MNKVELEERLINFSNLIIGIVRELKESKESSHLGSQLIRSGTSPALNYGEAQSAESKNDFIHKLTIVLKELRESNNNLKIILRSNLAKDQEKISLALNEVNELISIFVASINTLTNRKKSE